MAPFFDYQVYFSLVLPELQLFFEVPIVQRFDPAVVLVKKIVWHYRMQYLSSIDEKLFFLYAVKYNFHCAYLVS